MSNTIKHIGVLTSGGDAPGMNAAIRSVVRTSIFNKREVTGIQQGYCGLIDNKFVSLQSHSVSKIISLGGTFLKSSRCPIFQTPEGRAQAIDNVRKAGIDALVVIGGDGSFRGAHLLSQEFGFPVVGVPATIDNDIYGTDFTIGFDTALNTAVQAIDKLRDTADSHNLVFFVEVMGRDAGFIALHSSIATGAEATLVPEFQTDIKKLCAYLEWERRKNKTSGIVIVAEGGEQGGAVEIAQKVKEILPEYDTRVTTLGHIQRGGSPSCHDRVLASILGYSAVSALLEGKTDVMIGQKNGQIVYTPFVEACSRHNKINKKWHEISYILSL
ncbi:MAG: 6-phosphofructokinase [Prevotellaceae bacterium]|jgi:6-phosphofructokinase 1|nr:6-phosphofructokinase [Prevotellaceae bacterium]